MGSALPAAAAPPLYGELTPAAELLTLPAGEPGGFLTIRATRREVTLWGQPLAVLLYSGTLSQGQSEQNDGRYSLVMIPRDPVRESQFLDREVWPAIGSPFMSAGGFRGLEPAQVPAPDDGRLENLERNLLRAAWYPVALDLGLVGTGGPASRSAASSAFRRLEETVIAEEERNGFLHECQHALDEAWKVYPGDYARVAAQPADAELRAALAALAHSGSPHYELYQSVRQYRQQLPVYTEAHSRMFAWLASEVGREPKAYDGVRGDRNILLQLPRLSAAGLRRLAAQVMERHFAAADREAGYRLEYGAVDGAASDLRVGALRGDVEPQDLPEPGAPEGPLAEWRFAGQRVVSHGLHIYLSARGVQAARAERYGLAVQEGGYVALLVRAGTGPWRLGLEGGVFSEGETAGDQLPVRITAGEDLAVPVVAGEEPGRFVAAIPAAAARDGILRVIIRGAPRGRAPAFLAAVRLEQPES